MISPALPDDHPAWEDLRSYQQRRTSAPQRDATPPETLIQGYARLALASDWIADDLAADALAETVRRQVLLFGYRLIPRLNNEIARGLLGVDFDNAIAYPSFQFAQPDEFEEYDPHPTFVGVSDRLGADVDPIGALSWWLSPNAWLDNYPASLLGTNREPEVVHAAEQMRNDNW